MANPALELQRARTALAAGQVEAAARLCRRLLTDNPRDVDARHLQARCLAALARWREAAEDLRRVLTARNGDFTAMVDLGIVETFAGNHAVALAQLEQARAIDPRPAELHFALGSCRLGMGDAEGALAAFRDALARHPDFPDALNNLGVTYDRLGRMPEAIDSFRRAIAVHPRFADAYRNLADALSRSGERAAAIAAYREAAALCPSDAAIWAHLGAAHMMAGNSADAAECLERALTIDATLAQAAANLGECRRLLGQPQEAEAAFRQALDRDPRLAIAHLGLGQLAAAREDSAAAGPSLLQAAALGTDAGTAVAAATALEHLGLRIESLTALRAAIERNPGLADLHAAQGALLHRLGRWAEALDCYDAALEIDPARASTHLNIGHALEAMGAHARALASFEEALALQPADTAAMAAIVGCAVRLCEWDFAQNMLSRLLALPNGMDALNAFLMLAIDFDPGDIAQSLRRRPRIDASAGRFPWVPRPTGSHDRLRVAYVSPDYRVHPVAFAVAGLIERHDRTRVEPIGVSLAARDRSAIGGRLERLFDEFIDASAMGDAELIALLRAREIDIAVDLAGLTTGSRPALFANRVAPVQINYLGFPGSMGVDFMDFMVADDIVVPRSHESNYAERILRMPHTYLPFDDGRAVTPFNGGREAAGLPPEGFVFCAFTNGFKVTRKLFTVWMDLLHGVPGSILWLRSTGAKTAANLKAAAARSGIAVERLIFAPFVESMQDHLARLQLADLYLDTLPYNAHTTATEALWAGVPLVTCLGRTFAGRVGASVLTACGLADLICRDIDAYRALALSIGRSPAVLSSLKERLRAAKVTAPVFDTGKYAHDFEALLFASRQ